MSAETTHFSWRTDKLTNLGRESRFFLTLIQGKEPPSQPSYDPSETQHISALHKVCFRDL